MQIRWMRILTLFLPLGTACTPRTSHMMTFEDYVKVQHPVPYVLEAEDGLGKLIYYGSKHCFDPADPQNNDIEERWAAFKPTIALNEGWDPPVAPTRDEAISKYGEAGLLRWLAARDHVSIRNLEPSPDEEAANALKEYSTEQVKVFYVLRTMYQNSLRPSSERPPTKEGLVLGTIEHFHHVRALRGPPNNVEEFKSSALRLLPELNDWSNPPTEWFDPAPRGPQQWTNRLARRMSEYRDQYMVELIIGQLQLGRRVFAVVGASHVVMQEPEIRDRLRLVVRRQD